MANDFTEYDYNRVPFLPPNSQKQPTKRIYDMQQQKPMNAKNASNNQYRYADEAVAFPISKQMSHNAYVNNYNHVARQQPASKDFTMRENIAAAQNDYYAMNRRDMVKRGGSASHAKNERSQIRSGYY